MTGTAEAIVGRHARAIRILTCLQAGPAFNAKELANRLRVSRRTIYRDLNLIRGAGIRVAFDGESSGYKVGNSPNALAPPGFSDRDLAKLALTSHLSLLHGFADFGISVRESVARLLGHYPQNVREPIARLLNCCVVDLPRPTYSPRTQRIVEELIVSISSGRVVRIDFRDAQDELVTTRLAPYRLVASLKDWYVVGRSTAHREVARIAVSYIVDIEVTKESFHIPRNFRIRRKQTLVAVGE
jgi:predicted DNA-binding transcriptional regulator YafY